MGRKATEPLRNLLLCSRQEKRMFHFPNLLMQKLLHVSVQVECPVREQTHSDVAGLVLLTIRVH